jgi:ATP-dependent Lon protease
MKESAQAALSLIKGRASGLGLDPGMFVKSDIHIHVPAGAIPKDGPSAGVAMFTDSEPEQRAERDPPAPPF